MGLMLNKVNELVGDASVGTHPNVNSLYQAAINEVIDVLTDEELLKHSPTPISLTNPNSTWTLPGEVRILEVHSYNGASYVRANEVELSMLEKARDTNSLFAPTANSPIYGTTANNDHAPTLEILPVPDSTGAKIYYFKYVEEGEKLLTASGVYEGDFHANGSWVYGTGWNASTNKAVHTTGNTATLTYANSGYTPAIKNSTDYIVEFEIDYTSGGGVTFSVGGGVASAVQTSSGSVTVTSNASATTNVVTITPATDFVGSLDNIRVRIADGSADLATDTEPAHMPELAHHAVALRTAINVLVAKLSDIVQDDEDSEVQNMLNGQLAVLEKAYQTEIGRITGHHGETHD